MNFFALFTLVLATGIAVSASPMQKLRTSSRISEDKKQALRNRIRGCNANVCFAIDGSGSINSTEFTAEKEFVLDIVSIITVDDAVELAGVQFGIASSAISPLTTDFDHFIVSVADEPQLKSSRTFLVAGVNYCFSQLARRRGEALKMVVLGDGRSSIGADAVRRTDLFRSALNGDVCTVGAGFQDTDELLALTGGDPDRVFTVNNFLDVLDLEIIIEKIVEDICDVDHPESV